MDVREKLVELIGSTEYGNGSLVGKNFQKGFIEKIASNLIANGVTAQECGEWVYDHWCEFKCSVCGEFSNSKPYKGKEKYCPNCGAKMIPQPPKGE